MKTPVANEAESNEIFCRVVTQEAPRMHVVNLKIFGRTATLTTPTVTDENLPMKVCVCQAVQFSAWAFRAQFAHADFRTWAEKFSFIGFGNSSYSRHRA
jgi:hypothetical protein